MTEFVSFDPDVEVLGQSMMCVVAGMSKTAKPLLEKYGLDQLEEDKWYPLQHMLDFYREIYHNKSALVNLVNTGMKVPDNAVFPPEIDTIEKAFMSLDDAYHMNHRGGEIGNYLSEMIATRHILVTAHTPFPCDLDYGIILGLARRFKPKEAILNIYHDTEHSCRKRGADECRYHVRW